jgi:membrane protein implicated in regulation of membrane protease activity
MRKNWEEVTDLSWLESIYLICIGVGLLYSFITLFFGDSVTDWLHGVHLPALQPILWVSGLTAFGGVGFLLSRLTSFSVPTILALAFLGGAALAVAAYFIWVEPMSQAETSTGYSMLQLVGRVGEVWTTIPANGLGEVLISMVSGTTNNMAASLTNEPIKEGTRVLVVEVREHVLYVTPLQNQ